MCRNASHHFRTRLSDTIPTHKIWVAHLQQTATSGTASWMRELETGNKKQGSGFPHVFFSVPILVQSLRAFLFNGNDVSLDLGCKLLPAFLLLFHIRSHLRGSAGQALCFINWCWLQGAHSLWLACEEGLGAHLCGRECCWETAGRQWCCQESVEGAWLAGGYPRNRLNNT